MTKKLNTDHIRSELADSVFFRAPRPPAAPPEPPTPAPGPAEIPPTAPTLAVPERANARTGERLPGRRIITRNSFEIYEDQMQSLRTRAYQERMAGKLGSMSRMAREAIDRYLKDTPTEDTD